MRTLIAGILPQIMMLAGLAGIVWMVAQNGFPFKWAPHTEKFKVRLEAARKSTAERGVLAAEKLLRHAKIYAMRLERFFASRLEELAARKSANPAGGGTSFWKTIRDRSVGLRKPSTSPRVVENIAVGGGKKREDVLARLAQERDDTKERP